MRAGLELDCFDGSYSFALTMAGIIAIETKCDAGIGEIYARTLAGRYHLDGQSYVDPAEAKYRYSELLEIIRQGLIGGGGGLSDGTDVAVNAVRANQLIEAYIHPDKAPITRAWELAAAILFACIEGYEPAIEAAKDDGSKKKPDSGSTGVKSSPTD